MGKKNLARIADALAQIAEALVPVGAEKTDWDAAGAFLWDDRHGLQPVPRVSRVPVGLLQAIDGARDKLIDNTSRFACGLPANNALLWGAKGMGKSSLVKAVHGALEAQHPDLKLIEIHREDVAGLPALLNAVRAAPVRAIVFCDDLSFDRDDTAYKSLKAALDGGIEGRPENAIFYATSNRRHLLSRDMAENERGSAINPHETTDETVSLSDRFGLWLGFHNASQAEYLDMVRGYVEAYGLGALEDDWRPRALEWSITRGARSGRVAWQFVQELAGREGRRLD